MRDRLTYALRIMSVILIAVLAACATLPQPHAPDVEGEESRSSDATEWQMLFDGETLDGWKASETPGTFSVTNGELIVHGPRSHLFYTGSAHNPYFTNFELQLEVMTRPGSNSGVYFHTEYQQEGWPAKGFEVQINNSHVDPKRTAGLYGIEDNYSNVAEDDRWFTLTVRVEGKRIVTSVDGTVVIDYTQANEFVPPENHPQRRIDRGTFALQGHDPQSEVRYRKIRVRALP